ncbi:MAG: M15 family metallopeptidase [Deltaproteobacteria bacterium]|nr:M15 family metallopeptidase [Deltaproteobacteria bacterium]
MRPNLGCLRAILNWSALPGGSRHHWGTEMDVVDLAAVPPDYRVRLLPDEVAPGGPFHPLHQWLDENLERFGFFRPYARLQGGMYIGGRDEEGLGRMLGGLLATSAATLGAESDPASSSPSTATGG